MLRSELSDNSDAYIVGKGTTAVEYTVNANERNKI